MYLRNISDAYFSEYPRTVDNSFSVRRSPRCMDSRADKRTAGEVESRGVICGVGQNGCGLARVL